MLNTGIDLSYTINQKYFNIYVGTKIINFSWRKGCVALTVYQDERELTSFYFDNELFEDTIRDMFMDESFFLYDETRNGIINNLYKREYESENALKQPYMKMNYNTMFEDEEGNQLFILCSLKNIFDDYILKVNDEIINVRAMDIRRILFCLPYTQKAQRHYEYGTLTRGNEDGERREDEE